MPEACRKLSQSVPRGAGMQNMPMMQGGMPPKENVPMGQHISEAGRDYMQVMQGMNPPMMASMMIEDPDVAFLCTTIPHHQGAIGMARAVLKHGKDAKVKKLAEKTIKEQEEDIKELTEVVKMQPSKFPHSAAGVLGLPSAKPATGSASDRIATARLERMPRPRAQSKERVQMTYYFAKTVNMTFDEAVSATTEALKKHGFGVLTEIDVKETLKKEAGRRFSPVSHSWRVQSAHGS